MSYHLKGMGTTVVPAASVPSECTSWGSYLLTPECWVNPLPTWQAMANMTGQFSATPAGGPPAPTQAQLDAVASGQMTADQLTQQLANQQAEAQKAAMAAQVQPTTDPASVAANAIDAIPGGSTLIAAGAGASDPNAPCSMTIMSSVCDSTVYWGAGILAVVVALLLFTSKMDSAAGMRS